jgi:hypothetical protein
MPNATSRRRLEDAQKGAYAVLLAVVRRQGPLELTADDIIVRAGERLEIERRADGSVRLGRKFEK